MNSNNIWKANFIELFASLESDERFFTHFNNFNYKIKKIRMNVKAELLLIFGCLGKNEDEDDYFKRSILIWLWDSEKQSKNCHYRWNCNFNCLRKEAPKVYFQLYFRFSHSIHESFTNSWLSNQFVFLFCFLFFQSFKKITTFPKMKSSKNVLKRSERK